MSFLFIYSGLPNVVPVTNSEKPENIKEEKKVKTTKEEGEEGKE